MMDKLNWYTVGGIVVSLIGVTVMCYGLRKLYLAYDKQIKLEHKRQLKRERIAHRRQLRRERRLAEEEANRIDEEILKQHTELANKFRNEFVERYPEDIYDPVFRNWVKEIEQTFPGFLLKYEIVDNEYMSQLSD